MATPVFSLSTEILTDAPFEALAARLREPGTFACFRALGASFTVQESGGGLQVLWGWRCLGSEESGRIQLSPHARGAHLALEARHRGWTSFASFGLLRWRTDQLLERLVEEL